MPLLNHSAQMPTRQNAFIGSFHLTTAPTTTLTPLLEDFGGRMTKI